MKIISALVLILMLGWQTNAQSDHEALATFDFWTTVARWSTTGFDGLPDCSSPPVTITIPNGAFVILRDEVITLNCAVNLVIENGGTLSCGNTDGTTTRLDLGTGSTIQVQTGGQLVTNITAGGDHAQNGVMIGGFEVWNGAGNNDFAGDDVVYSEGEILPIELLTFGAKREPDKVVVSWSTATEIDNDYFTILRSPDGATYQEIGKVDGSGDSNDVLTYSFDDNQPIQGVSYYRLKQTDYDGRYEEFKPIFVDFMPIVNELVFYPNPTDGIFLMEYDQRSPYPRIYDTTGNVVTSTENFTKLSNQLQINISSLKRGVYLVSYKGKHYKIFKN